MVLMVVLVFVAGVEGGEDDRRGEGRDAELDDVGVASVDIDSAGPHTQQINQKVSMTRRRRVCMRARLAGTTEDRRACWPADRRSISRRWPSSGFPPSAPQRLTARCAESSEAERMMDDVLLT